MGGDETMFHFRRDWLIRVIKMIVALVVHVTVCTNRSSCLIDGVQ